MHDHAEGADGPTLGVVLAGGFGLRMGGAKATVALHGRPLISYPLQSLRRALGEAVVVAKPETELPSLPGVTVWLEPPTPVHPLVGLVHALERARDRPVFVCAADLPFVTPRLVCRILLAARGRDAAIAASEGRWQPLVGWYHPSTLALLSDVEVDADTGAPMRKIVAGLGPEVVEVETPEELFNVNAPDDLLHASAIMDAPSAGARERKALERLRGPGRCVSLVPA